MEHAPEYSLPMSSRSRYVSLPIHLLVLNQQKMPLLCEESTQRAIDNAVHNLEFHEHFRTILNMCRKTRHSITMVEILLCEHVSSVYKSCTFLQTSTSACEPMMVT